MSDGKVEFRELTVKVTKETSEVWDALAEVVKQAKAAGANGFQAAVDIPQVLLGSLQKLSKGMAGLGEVPEEVKMALPEFIQANGTGAGMVGAEIARKHESPEEEDATA